MGGGLATGPNSAARSPRTPADTIMWLPCGCGVKPYRDSADQFCMKISGKVMLFSPPLPPLALTTEQTIVIGRQAQCDLSLQDNDVSRAHAEVSFEEGQYMLRDLGSTNGTFLNGKEISEPTPLTPGDKIEVGPREVTFCELQGEAADSSVSPDAAATIIAARLPSSETFVGDLSQIPPFAVLQVLEMGSKSGVLEIEGPGLSCQLWMHEGVPIHAQSDRQTGFDAALSIVNIDRGRFRFEPQAVNVEPTIACTVTELLMEGCRLLDEQDA
jgi:hypothetical protein